MKALALIVSLLLPVPVLAQVDPVMTCGLEDCSVLGDRYYEMEPTLADRMRAVEGRLMVMSKNDVIELVALSIGQVGCYAGWPGEGMTIDPYYDAAVTKMVRNLRLAPDEAEFFSYEVWEIFLAGLDELAAQGRLVSITEYEDELIPAACATL